MTWDASPQCLVPTAPPLTFTRRTDLGRFTQALLHRISDRLQALAARTCKHLQVRLQVLASTCASTCRRLASPRKSLACRPLFTKACRPSKESLQRLQFVRKDSESQRQGLQVLVYKHLQILRPPSRRAAVARKRILQSRRRACKSLFTKTCKACEPYAKALEVTAQSSRGTSG